MILFKVLGETGRSMEIRLKENVGSFKNGKLNS